MKALTSPERQPTDQCGEQIVVEPGHTVLTVLAVAIFLLGFTLVVGRNLRPPLAVPGVILALVCAVPLAAAQGGELPLYLAAVLAEEVSAREGHGGDARVKAARFPAVKTIDDFDFKVQSSVKRTTIAHLAQLDFLAETLYGTDVIADIIDARVGNSSLTVICAMSQEGRVTVRGSAVLVHMDHETKSSKRIPDELRQRISSHRP